MSRATVVFSVVTDGPSDSLMLVPILKWLLARNSELAFRYQAIDLRVLPRPPSGLKERVAATIELTQCDLLFVHRDGEGRTREERLSEIRAATGSLESPWVPVVPIRMSEAWLLFDEKAVRRAAGNPSGTVSLQLPPVSKLETIPDPKGVLQAALRTASESHGRRLRQFDTRFCQRRLADLIDDISPLLRVPAFQSLVADLARVLPSIAT